MRLRHLLLVLINSIIFVAFLGHAAYSAWERSAESLRQIQRDVHSLAASVAAGAANELLEHRFDQIETLLLRSAAIGEVMELAVADAEGKIMSLVRVDRDGRAQPIYLPEEQRIEALWQQQGGDQYRALVAIDFGEPIGWVGISASLAKLSEIRHQIWFDSLAAALLTAAVASLVLMLVISQLTRRIEAATEFAEKLDARAGNLLGVPSRIHEIKRLQSALNNAALVLQQRFAALQNSEARKAAVIEATLDSLITVDSGGRITALNPAAVTTFGYSSEEAIGAYLSDLIIPQQHRAAHIEGMRHHRKTGIGPILHQRLEMTALRRDGSEFPVELTVVPFELDGQTQFLGSLRDISKQAALQIEQKRTRALLEQTLKDLAAREHALNEHAIVTIADRHGNITYANAKMCAISQYSSEELLGQNHRLLKSGLHEPGFYADLWRTIAAGKVWHGELTNRRKDGSIYWVASTIMPLLDFNGVPYQYIAIRTDISGQKQTELELAANHERLEQTLTSYHDAQEELKRARVKEVAIGSQIQSSLLFGEVPAELGELSIAAHTEAAQGIDGDFYDFFTFGPSHIDLAIGDVMGKGVSAALLGAALKQQLNRSMTSSLSLAGQPPQPSTLINDVHAKATPRLIELETFITLTYLRVDLDVRRVTHVNAGHTPTILARAGNTRLLSGDNLPLGVFESENYSQSSLDLEPGDLLFLYSDGATEARNPEGEEFGIDRLQQLVGSLHAQKIPARMLLQAVRVHLQQFEQSLQPSDDRTCIAILLNDAEPPGCSSTSIELPWALDQLALLRHEIAALATTAAFDEAAASALVLAAFEAATNVIRHTPQPLPDATLHCRIEATPAGLNVILHYLGAAFEPALTEPDFSGDSDGGFGLYIIQNSVDEVIYDTPTPGVCRIRLEKRRPAAMLPPAQ